MLTHAAKIYHHCTFQHMLVVCKFEYLLPTTHSLQDLSPFTVNRQWSHDALETPSGKQTVIGILHEENLVPSPKTA